MKNKLKLVLWGKNLQLPEDYDNLEFDRYELKNYDKCYDLYIYKNNKLIKEIWYWDNGNKNFEFNYKNGKSDGKQYKWYSNGKLYREFNCKNGNEDGKQYWWSNNGELYCEYNYKNGKRNGKQYEWSFDGNKMYEGNYKNGKQIK